MTANIIFVFHRILAPQNDVLEAFHVLFVVEFIWVDGRALLIGLHDRQLILLVEGEHVLALSL
jgi:hypothetical protein